MLGSSFTGPLFCRGAWLRRGCLAAAPSSEGPDEGTPHPEPAPVVTKACWRVGKHTGQVFPTALRKAGTFNKKLDNPETCMRSCLQPYLQLKREIKGTAACLDCHSGRSVACRPGGACSVRDRPARSPQSPCCSRNLSRGWQLTTQSRPRRYSLL